MFYELYSGTRRTVTASSLQITLFLTLKREQGKRRSLGFHGRGDPSGIRRRCSETGSQAAAGQPLPPQGLALRPSSPSRPLPFLLSLHLCRHGQAPVVPTGAGSLHQALLLGNQEVSSATVPRKATVRARWETEAGEREGHSGEQLGFLLSLDKAGLVAASVLVLRAPAGFA